jgi:peptidase M23-like protein
MKNLGKTVHLPITPVRRKVCSEFKGARSILLAVLALLAVATAVLARERGPRVEVVCTSPPIPVRIDKQQVLVYELHITNFDVVPLTLKRVEVFADDGSTGPIASLDENALAAAMIRVGSGMMPSGDHRSPAGVARVIEPGARSVIYMWIPLPTDRSVASSLRHRMIFSAAAAGGANPTDVILENFQVPISHDAVLMLRPPFHAGIWLAGDGPANNTNHRRTITAVDGHIYSAERFAIDWIKVGPNGDSRHDGATRNDNWWGWGEPVLAVAEGEITEVVDGIPDNVPRVLPPVTLENIAGNHVILKIAPNRYVTYAHLQNGSIKVRVHDRVHAGDALALLGNSGNTTGAHLHMQITDHNSVLEAEGVPFVFAKFTYLGPGADYELDKHVTVPWTQSIPPGDGVVEFEGPKE